MTVVKAKRKQSQFEVFHHLNKLRKEITDLLLRDFGYDDYKAYKNHQKILNGRDYDELSEKEKIFYDSRTYRDASFHEWFIISERNTVVDLLRKINICVYVANSIYPMYGCELLERRTYQDKAIGYCYALIQELQYAIETLPVDVNKYTRFAEMIQTEINLIKGWRKSDNKFVKTVNWAISDNVPSVVSSTNFANVNNNGNANNNNASNTNGVRPDFDLNSSIKV